MVGRIAFLIGTFAVCCFCAPITIAVNDSASVSGTVVRLSDIARISGDTKTLLDTVVICQNAVPGTVRWISRDELSNYSRTLQRVKSEITVVGAMRCRVRSVGNQLLLKKSIAVVESQMKGQLAWKSEDVTFRYTDSSQVLATIPPGEYSLLLEPIHNPYLKGSTVIRATVRVGTSSTSVSIPLSILVKTAVCVATRELHPGESIETSDFTVERKDITKLLYEPILSVDQMKNSKVKSAVIPEGGIFTTNKIATQKTIETGDPVRIVSKIGTVTVAIDGIARESGDIGSIITVENVTSKKILTARVVNGSTVQVGPRRKV